jgi:glycosyltransferase involved in cell wall biosynthesis
MKVAFLVPVYNKEKHLRQCIQSVLNQNYSGMEIILSDHGSTDNSLGILREFQTSYNGPNKVRVLECPIRDHRYMAGLNDHLNWLHTQTDADIIVVTSADDWNHPDRTSKVVKCFEDYHSDEVGTAVQFIEENEIPSGVTAYDGRPGFISPKDMVEKLVGGSSSHAWTHEFFDAIKPIVGSTISDIYFGYLSSCRKGFFYLNEVLYAYYNWNDSENTGLGGVMRAEQNEDEKYRLHELAQYQITSSYFSVYNKMAEMNLLNETTIQPLIEEIVRRGKAWTIFRDLLTDKRLTPMSLRT